MEPSKEIVHESRATPLRQDTSTKAQGRRSTLYEMAAKLLEKYIEKE
jgi:hypothetical protein